MSPLSATSRRAQALVASLLALFFLTILGTTWGRWGHVRVDSGGAIYRATRIAEGATLYQDVQVHYPPLAPYAVGGLFAVAGTHLDTVYALGLLLVLAESALLWSVARRFLSFPETAAGLAGFWGLLAFQPTLFNWMVPNVFASTLGALFATATVAFLAADVEKPRRAFVVIASIAAALAGLSKLEHGLAAVMVLTVYALTLERTERSPRRRLAAAWLPGLIVAVIAAGLVLATVPFETAVFDNIYRERSFTETLEAYQRRLFPSWAATFAAAAATYIVLGARALVAAQGLVLFGRGGGLAILGITLAVFAVALPLLPTAGFTVPDDLRIDAVRQLQYGWASLGWVGAIGWAVWKLRSDSTAAPRVVLLVGVFSLAATFRWGFHVAWPAYYAVFAPFLSVLLVRTLITHWAGAHTSYAVALVMASFALHGSYVRYANVYAPTDFALEYPRGTIRTTPPEGEPMKSVVDYLRKFTKPGDPVAVLPEEQLINFLAETRHPTRDTGIGPGWLATPEDEDRFLNELEAAGTRYVVLSSRRYPEFQSGGVADYNPRIVDYIESRYEPVLSAGIYTVYRLRTS